MTTVVVASIADAPGASTLAVGLASAWPAGEHAPVLVEADPDGGRLGTRLGVGVEPGLMAVALESRRRLLRVDDLLAVAAPVGDWLLVASPPSPEQTHSALMYSAATVASAIGDDGRHVWIVDVGRVTSRSPAFPFVLRAGHVLLVTKGDLAALQLVPSRVDALRAANAPTVSLVVAGRTSWPLDEVAAFVGCDVAAQVPHVRHAGGFSTMSDRPWQAWWHAVDDLAQLLAGASVEPVEMRA